MTRSIYQFFSALALLCVLVSCKDPLVQGGTQSGNDPYKYEAEIDPEIVDPVAVPNARIDDGRHVTAYVTYYGSITPNPAVLTHINYSSAELYMEDGVYMKFDLRGNKNRFQQIVGLKEKYPSLKICLVITDDVANSDNKQGGGFSALAKSDENMKRFADDCVAFMDKWGIDGIEIAWQFPGISWLSAACDVAQDTDNYVKLMKRLREALGDKFELSYAGYCTDKVTVTGGYRFIDIAAMNPYVDYVNIITYDMDEAPHHHSALNDLRAYKDCNRAVNAYLNAGVNPNKLVLEIPFYGRHSFSQSPTVISYKSIIQMDRKKYRRNQWDDTAQGPYVETMQGVFFCGYDNPKSIAAKGNWVRQKGMLGMGYWEYEMDDAQGTLRTAVWNAVMTE